MSAKMNSIRKRIASDRPQDYVHCTRLQAPSTFLPATLASILNLEFIVLWVDISTTTAFFGNRETLRHNLHEIPFSQITRSKTHADCSYLQCRYPARVRNQQHTGRASGHTGERTRRYCMVVVWGAVSMSSCVLMSTFRRNSPTRSLSTTVPMGFSSVPTLSTRCLKGSATLQAPVPHHMCTRNPKPLMWPGA